MHLKAQCVRFGDLEQYNILQTMSIHSHVQPDLFFSLTHFKYIRIHDCVIHKVSDVQEKHNLKLMSSCRNNSPPIIQLNPCSNIQTGRQWTRWSASSSPQATVGLTDGLLSAKALPLFRWGCWRQLRGYIILINLRPVSRVPDGSVAPRH